MSTILDFAAARDDGGGDDSANQNSEDMQSSNITTSALLQARCPSYQPTNSVKAPMA